MKTAKPAKDFEPGAQQQVIGIREQNLGTRIFERLRQLRFDRGLGAHGHEKRRLDFPVQRAKRRRPRARIARRGVDPKLQPPVTHTS